MSRKKSREFALQILYQLDISDKWDNTELVLKSFFQERKAETQIRDYCEFIIKGIQENKEFIDELVNEQYNDSSGNVIINSVSALHYIDRNVIRLALFELFLSELIPIDVAINEAINLAKKYGEQKSGSLVNAILDNIKNNHSSKLEYKKDL